MKSYQNQLKELLDKPEWTEDEKSWLFNFLESADSSELQDLMKEQFQLRLEQSATINPEQSKKMLEGIHQKTGMLEKPGRKIINMVFVRVAAASIIIILLAGVFYLNKNGRNHNNLANNETPLLKNDIAPGGNKAILTLANGATIILDSAQNGTLSSQGNIKIIKLDDGQLAYDKSGVSNNSEVLYNTISTPKGGQYQLILSDGSKVWLNAESSLRFPAAFPGGERKVELTGEGYFEVAHNPSKPFKVSVSNAVVEVLGTHFNINAYEDENVIKTTLLEGSVKMSSGNKSQFIVPGQQAEVNESSDEISVNNNVNLDEVVAWKNGKFYFDNVNIKTIMKQIARWYDVEVEYKGNVSKIFGGTISRNVNVSNVFKIMEATGGVHFTIEGRKVIVAP